MSIVAQNLFITIIVNITFFLPVIFNLYATNML